MPILPVPNKDKLDILLPLNFPEPIVLATVADPMVKERPLRSIASFEFPKVTATPPFTAAFGDEIVKSFDNCTVVSVPVI